MNIAFLILKGPLLILTVDLYAMLIRVTDELLDAFCIICNIF